MKDKILGYGESHICLYCGNEIKGRYDDREEYFECTCEDTIKKQSIENLIHNLKNQIPKYNFEITKRTVLTPINKNNK